MDKTSYGFIVWLPSTSCMIFFWFLIMSRVMWFIYLLFSFFLSVFYVIVNLFPIPNVYSQFVSDTLLFLCDKISNICSILFLLICSFGFAIPVYHLSRTGCFLTFCSKTAILHLHCIIYNVVETLCTKKSVYFCDFFKKHKKKWYIVLREENKAIYLQA